MAQNTVYKVRTRGTIFAQSVEFGVHVQQVLTTGGPSDLAGSWVANVVPLVTAATVTHLNLTEIVVSDVSPGTDLTLHLPITQPAPGLIAGEALPMQCAAVVQLQTLQKGKRHRGRFFLPGIGEGGTSNYQLAGAQLTAIQNLASQLIAFYGPNGSQTSYRLCIFSPPNKPPKVHVPPPLYTNTLITPVNGTAVDVNVRSQRRREIGVGR